MMLGIRWMERSVQAARQALASSSSLASSALVRRFSASAPTWAGSNVPRREDYMATDPVYGRTVKVRGDPEQHFRLLNNVLAAEGVLRALKAKEFAQAPGITRRLRKKEERRRIMRYEANKKILQVLDPEGRCVPPPRARPVGAPMSPPPSLTARFPLIGARSVPPNVTRDDDDDA